MCLFTFHIPLSTFHLPRAAGAHLKLNTYHLTLTSDFSFHLVAVEVTSAHDDVVIERDAYGVAGAFHALREGVVLDARPGIVARVVMSEDYAAGEVGDGVLEYYLLIAYGGCCACLPIPLFSRM